MNRPLILHVEDDPNDVFLFSRAFKKADLHAELQTIEDGEALINHLAKAAEAGGRHPALLLLDIKLPRKSGFEVLEWLRAHPHKAEEVRQARLIILGMDFKKTPASEVPRELLLKKIRMSIAAA